MRKSQKYSAAMDAAAARKTRRSTRVYTRERENLGFCITDCKRVREICLNCTLPVEKCTGYCERVRGL